MRSVLRLLLLALAVAAMPFHANAQSLPVVARLGDVQLTAADVRSLLDSQPPQARQQILASPESLDRLIRTELVRRAVLTEARGNGWDKRPEVVAQIERAREQVLVASYVNNLARPPADYPTESDIQAFYEANKATLVVGPRYRVAQIYVSKPPNGDAAAVAAAQKRAETLAAQARAADADFAELARKNSEHPESAKRGGEIGWITLADAIPEIRPVLPKLPRYGVSDPIPSAEGWHIVKLLDSAPESVATPEQVRPMIVNTLRLRRAQELERQYLDALLDKSPVKVDSGAVDALRQSLR